MTLLSNVSLTTPHVVKHNGHIFSKTRDIIYKVVDRIEDKTIGHGVKG